MWTLLTPPGVMGKAEAVGYAICHRIEARSFLINEQPMPLCARCTGIYLGVMVSFLVAVASGRTRAGGLPPRRVLIFFGLFVVAMGIDGVNSYFHLFPGFEGIYSPHNVLRLVTGMLCGLAVFNVIFPVFNNLAWVTPDPVRSIGTLRELLGLLAVAGVVIVLVLSERAIFLWVFGILSALGVVLLLTMVGTVLFMSFTKSQRTVTRARDLLVPLVAGLTLAMLQIGAMDLLRFWLTGTWSGFNF
jgi:uncharacterized membrane protein